MDLRPLPISRFSAIKVIIAEHGNPHSLCTGMQNKYSDLMIWYSYSSKHSRNQLSFWLFEENMLYIHTDTAYVTKPLNYDNFFASELFHFTRKHFMHALNNSPLTIWTCNSVSGKLIWNR